MKTGGLQQRARNVVKDVAIRAHVMDYRPLGWDSQQWELSFTNGHTQAYANDNEAARYGVLIGYLSAIGRVGTVLDIGCGDGVLRRRMSSEYFDHYLGVDPTAAAIKQAQQYADGRTEFVQLDVLTDVVDLADVVICSESLYLAPDPIALADRAIALVRPGGSLLTSIWRHPGDAVIWNHLDHRMTLVDRVWIKTKNNRFATRGWQVAWHKDTNGAQPVQGQPS